MIGLKYYQIQTGEKILIEIQGYDPRDIFRGYYSMIQPVFMQDEMTGTDLSNVRIGQALYAPYTLSGEIAIFDKLTLKKPTKKYLLGEVRNIPQEETTDLIFVDSKDKEYTKTDYYYNDTAYYQQGSGYVLCFWQTDYFDAYENAENCKLFEAPPNSPALTTPTKTPGEKQPLAITATLKSVIHQTKYRIYSDFHLDAFYQDKISAQNLDKDLRLVNNNTVQKAYARVAVDSSGNATIIEIVTEDKTWK